jgi:hypothetical protein
MCLSESWLTTADRQRLAGIMLCGTITAPQLPKKDGDLSTSPTPATAQAT